MEGSTSSFTFMGAEGLAAIFANADIGASQTPCNFSIQSPLIDLMLYVRTAQDALEAMEAAGAPSCKCRATALRLEKETVAALDRLVGKKYRKDLVRPTKLPWLGNHQHTYYLLAVMNRWMTSHPRTEEKRNLAKFMCAEFVNSPRVELSAIFPNTPIASFNSPFITFLKEDGKPDLTITHAHMATQSHVAALSIALHEVPGLQIKLLTDFAVNVHLLPVGVNSLGMEELISWINDCEI